MREIIPNPVRQRLCDVGEDDGAKNHSRREPSVTEIETAAVSPVEVEQTTVWTPGASARTKGLVWRLDRVAWTPPEHLYNC